MYQIQITPQSPVDEKWYAELRLLLQEMGETFEVLMPPLSSLETNFALFERSGYSHIPGLYPEVTNIKKFVLTRKKLEDLKKTITGSEKIAAVRDLYDARIGELITNIDMILAAHHRNDRAFREANIEVYGQPDPEIFTAEVAWIRSEAKKRGDEYPEMEEICSAVLSKIPEIEGDVSRLFPNPEVFTAVRQLHFESHGYYEQLFGASLSMENGIYTPKYGDAITNKAIQNVGSDFMLNDSPLGLWAVLQSQRTVVRPTDYALGPEAYFGIVAHEVGSHLLESTNGAKSSLKLLELGLDRYELGNEGRAFLREQIMYQTIDDYVQQPLWYPTKASWEYRIAIHLIISLAVGLHRRQYTFPELFEIVRCLYRFWIAKRGQELDEVVVSRGAWSLVVRALKGTNGQGGAYCKDIVYLEGNSRCWQVASERPELILYGDYGKFDIANKAHVMMLEELGVLPKHQ